MQTKTLDQWLDYISLTHPAEIEMGLERINVVFDRLALNISNTYTITVGGTNGKGSTVAMLAAGLNALGYRVGTYTSPHITHYNERVSIDQKAVSDAQLIQAFECIESHRGDIPLTYFEYGTLAAFLILFQESVDVVILEVGLGGRLDAVNIINPQISIITSVDIDHAEYLGDTLDQIGLEKAGILRKNGVFIGGEYLPPTTLNVAKDLACHTLLCHRDFRLEESSEKNIVHLQLEKYAGFPSVKLPVNNILLALQALAVYVENKTNRVLTLEQYQLACQAIENVHVPGRLELISKNLGSEIYLDVGHNPHAARYLARFLTEQKEQGKRIQIVYSSLRDKDAQGVLSHLVNVVDRCCLAPLMTPRAMSLDELELKARLVGIQEVVVFDLIDHAFIDALRFAGSVAGKKQSIITLIFGSFFMVEAAKRFFESYD